MSNTDTQKTPDTSSAANGRVGSSDSSASDLIDALDMMRDEFQRIIACPGCNAEIEDLANRAQLKLVQRVPVIVQRDEAQAELSRLRGLFLELIELTKLARNGRISAYHVNAVCEEAFLKPNTRSQTGAADGQ